MLPQIHAHYELRKASRHRRNLAITGGVALSIISAPVVAAVSVGSLHILLCPHSLHPLKYLSFALYSFNGNKWIIKILDSFTTLIS